MKKINLYIQESLNKVDVDKIKDFLIKKYKVSTWEECIDAQKFGTCDSIVKSIIKAFPNTFDTALDIYINFSDIAIKKLNSLGDNDDMFGNHYVLKRGTKIYDFARGANCIKGIYTLTQKEDNSDKYDIILTKEEQKLIKEIYKRKFI